MSRIKLWKPFFNALLESLAMSDPNSCAYYMQWRREAELGADITPYRAPSRQALFRPIEGARRRGRPDDMQTGD